MALSLAAFRIATMPTPTFGSAQNIVERAEGILERLKDDMENLHEDQEKKLPSLVIIDLIREVITATPAPKITG